MQLVFVSNYFNHHQQPVSDRLHTLCQKQGGSYTFIQTEPMEEERIKMGWGEILKNTPYVKKILFVLYLCATKSSESLAE